MSNRAADYWNDKHRDPEQQAHDNFLSHPLVQGYISLRAFGSLVSQMDTLYYEMLRRTEPGARILSVGCGGAGKERFFASKLPDREFVAMDIADEILEIARQQNAAEGVTNLRLELGDFNELDVGEGTFDLVLGLGAIHHVEGLEAFWKGVRRALKPGGVLIAQEFIGPNRMQWTPAQIEHGDRVLREVVPNEHRVHHDTVVPTPVEEMLRLDPSEAVRSAEILSTARDADFEIDGYCSGGGALLQPVLMYQVATFDPRNWQHNLVLAKLFDEEDRLMREGVLEDDFAMFLGVPPQSR